MPRRREFIKFLGLISLVFSVGTLADALRKFWKRATAKPFPAAPVSAVEEIPVGGYKLFRYPTESDPCILIRLDPVKFVAFNQHCTHLACPVYFDHTNGQLACPCHKGSFSAEDGTVLAGPANRPLEALAISIRDGRVWAEQTTFPENP